VKRLICAVLLSSVVACAGMASRPQADFDPAGRWNGYILHDGMRAPILVLLDEDGSGWQGTYSDSDTSVPLSGVRVSNGGSVHFVVQGNVAFDGSVAGNSMAGTVSGASAGSFALDRKPDWNPFPNGP
jgi:hypothetical protein